ncbi:MAG: hypothetical protein P4N41_01390 [Negativicutes bacterium]|nr:hypothetical protein [Negativicutes bacterium]
MGGTPYRLYFGNRKAGKPDYEIERQRNYIEKEKQDVCVLEGVQPSHNGAAPWTGEAGKLFSGVIVAVSLLLIVLLIPKLNVRK